MFVNFSEEAQHILKQAEQERDLLKHPYVGTEHLFLSALKDENLKLIFRKYNITYDLFKEKLVKIVGQGSKKSDFVLYTPLLKKIIENSVIEAREENSEHINKEIILMTMLDENDGIACSILRMFKVNIDKLYMDLKSKKSIKKSKKRKLLLEEIGTDLVKLSKEGKLDPVIGREEEIKQTIEVLLRRKKNNPILIGPAGVGKTAIVEGLANLINTANCPNFLKNKRLISLNIYTLVSGTKYRGEFEEKMKNIIKELEENDDIILFIDEIHTMVGAGGAEGAIDASNIFKPALARGSIKVIGATTIEEYKKFIEPDAALSRRFQQVVISEPNQKDLIMILEKIKPFYEKYHNIKINNEVIHYIVELSNKYLINRYEPDRSIDILDEVCTKVSLKENISDKKIRSLLENIKDIKSKKSYAIINREFNKAYELKKKENSLKKSIESIKTIKKVVTKMDVKDIIKKRSGARLDEINKERMDFYKSLNDNLNSIVVGQKENINKIIKSLQKRDIIGSGKCYSVAILGEAGSGKTLLSESYLRMLVGEKNIVRIDGSEYKDYHNISKLIGTTAGYLGYDNKNNIFEKVRSYFKTALLVENFDEGCEAFQNIFLKILKEGQIEDASGKLINFKNATIIFTMSSGSSEKTVGFEQKKDDIFISNEILNNVSLKIKLNRLDDESLKKVIKNKINSVIECYKNIKIDVQKSYRDYIYDLVKKNSKLSIIDETIRNDLEYKIIDSILDNQKKLIVDHKFENVV